MTINVLISYPSFGLPCFVFVFLTLVFDNNIYPLGFVEAYLRALADLTTICFFSSSFFSQDIFFKLAYFTYKVCI